MAFQFGFGSDDGDAANAEDFIDPEPNRTKASMRPVKEHDIKELVGKNIISTSPHLSVKRSLREFSIHLLKLNYSVGQALPIKRAHRTAVLFE